MYEKSRLTRRDFFVLIPFGSEIPALLSTLCAAYLPCPTFGASFRHMKLLFCLPFLLLSGNSLFAQSGAVTDTTIFNVAEIAPIPILASCQPERHPVGWSQDSMRRCAEVQLQLILARNIRYPEAARQAGTEGTTVLSFVVEPSGRMTGIGVLKDIGNGCGPEALRVLQALDSLGLRWYPGTIKGKAVRTRQALPIRFKLQEELPFYLSDNGDSVYVKFDTPAAFKQGQEALEKFVINHLEYPAAELDSCKTGVVEMALLIYPNNTVEVANQLDYNNLGLEFQWQALRFANHTAGMWQPAMYGNKAVAVTYPMRVVFKSPKPGCAAANAKFDRTMLLANEGAQLSEQGKEEAAVAKWSEALKLQPNNTELLYYRGTALLNLNKRAEACKDFTRVKALLGMTWFEDIRRLVCGN